MLLRDLQGLLWKQNTTEIKSIRICPQFLLCITVTTARLGVHRMYGVHQMHPCITGASHLFEKSQYVVKAQKNIPAQTALRRSLWRAQEQNLVDVIFLATSACLRWPAAKAPTRFHIFELVGEKKGEWNSYGLILDTSISSHWFHHFFKFWGGGCSERTV